MAGSTAGWLAIGMAAVLCGAAYLYFTASAARVDMARLKARNSRLSAANAAQTTASDEGDAMDFDISDRAVRWQPRAPRKFGSDAKTAQQAKRAQRETVRTILQLGYDITFEDDDDEPAPVLRQPSRERVTKDES